MFGTLLVEGIPYSLPYCLAPPDNSLQVSLYVLVSTQMHFLYKADRHMIALWLPPVKNFCVPAEEFWRFGEEAGSMGNDGGNSHAVTPGIRVAGAELAGITKNFRTTEAVLWQVLRLTSQNESAMVLTTTTCCTGCGGKEPIMTMQNISDLNTKSMMGFCYFGYFKACFFAGLFYRAKKPIPSGI